MLASPGQDAAWLWLSKLAAVVVDEMKHIIRMELSGSQVIFKLMARKLRQTLRGQSQEAKLRAERNR